MTATVHKRMLNGVVTLVIDNPPLNLLSMAIRLRLAELAEQIKSDPECRAVVITGAGSRAFSAGSDVREFPDDAAAGAERAKIEHHCFAAIESLPQPTIAVLHGHVLGGGLELALACDIRVAEETVDIGLPEITLGLLPCGGGTQRLPRLIGKGMAMALLLLGDRITAAQAEKCGLAEYVVSEGTAVSVAQKMAERIAAAPVEATKGIKYAVSRGLTDGIEVGFALEEELVGPLFASSTARAAVRRFRDRALR